MFWQINVEDSFWTGILIVSALILLKAFATSLTIKAGGVAGIFAPALFLGSGTGYVFSRIGVKLGLDLSVSNFTLVAMCGVMAGVLHAPLTSIFLIAEVTGGYELFIPLMISAGISYLTVRYFTGYGIYTRQLAKRGELITHHKDQAVLTLMSLKEEIETNFTTIHAYENLGQLVQVISISSRNLFPVIDDDNRFIGVVNLNDVREVMFDRDRYESSLVHEYMTSAPEYIHLSDSMESVMEKFDSSGAWNLPVVNHDGTYVGFVSKSKLFSAYRKKLRDFYTND
jgi:CIC family chloride channel protein